MSNDKQWASKYLLDPLTAPQPSEETGPGTSFTPANRAPSGSGAAHRKPVPSTNSPPVTSGSRNSGYPTPPGSASPHDQHDHRKQAFAAYDGGHRNRPSVDQSNTSTPVSSRQSIDQSSNGIPSPVSPIDQRRRGSSLSSRFEGDQSHRPLEILRRESRKAHRSPHLRKKYIPGTDTIDNLDTTGGYYHHEGPFDAALLSRNLRLTSSPVDALRTSNAEALKATPRENIQDSIERHRPLDGVAFVPPGLTDKFGRTYTYEEGADLQREEGGDMGRWPGIKYLPGDLKGKGEPSYTLEKALKEHKQHGHRRIMSDGVSGYEMTPRSTHPQSSSFDGSHRRSQSEWQSDPRRSGSGNNAAEGLTRRPGRKPVAM
ncbi:MAG: hypothetical protein M1812_006452 [Candelaria pacifica]|nr:MAG: hypothetical protein M1812_006452 [Candelaria pacifica]